MLDGRPCAVVGVLPASFAFALHPTTDLWTNGDRGVPRAFPCPGDITTVPAAAGAQLVPPQPMDDATATRVAPLVARLLDEADHYYESAQYGLPRLAWRSAWAVATARHVDRDIGVDVRRRSSHAWRERVVVTTTPATIARVLQGGLEATWTRGPAPTAAGPSRRGLYTPATLG